MLIAKLMIFPENTKFFEKKIISPYEVPYDKSTTMIMPFINDLPSLTITLDIFRQVNVRNYFYILT